MERSPRPASPAEAGQALPRLRRPGAPSRQALHRQPGGTARRDVRGAGGSARSENRVRLLPAAEHSGCLCRTHTWFTPHTSRSVGGGRGPGRMCVCVCSVS